MKEEPMQITIDTTQPLSATDTTILQLLLDGDAAVPVTEAPAQPTPAPAKKAATPRKTAAAKAKDPEPQLVGDPDPDGPSLDDAVARAQELVGLKLTQQVKDAVKEVSGEVKRVSELTGDEIGQFLDAVKDLGKDDDDSVV